jgi:TIR domain
MSAEANGPGDFPVPADTVAATLAGLFRHQGDQLACEILDNAVASIEETDYDNRGTYYYTLFLDVPLKLFARIEPDSVPLEKMIHAKCSSALRSSGNRWIQKVSIKPIPEQPATATARTVAPLAVEHIWKPGMLRAFLSHVAVHKVAVSKLKVELLTFGVSSFVAHEDIEPTKEWQIEIELALRSMQTLVALLTPGFHESKWTDQEVGFALGRGVPIIAVRLGLDPYGFIGKQQALPGALDFPGPLASSIVDLLLNHKAIAASMRESLVVGLEKAQSFACSKAVTGKLERLDFLTADQLQRLEAACQTNDQVESAFGVHARIANLIERLRPKYQAPNS